MQSLKVGPENRQAIAAIAESLRRRAEQAQPAFSTRQIIDVCFPGTRVTGRHLPSGVHDLVCVDEDAFRSHRAPHVIFYNRRLSSERQRYAIAHALAHIIFDGSSATCSHQRDARELRCDCFADELLLPLSRLGEFVSAWPSDDGAAREDYLDQVDRIASHFHVPAVVVNRRIRELWALVKN